MTFRNKKVRLGVFIILAFLAGVLIMAMISFSDLISWRQPSLGQLYEDFSSQNMWWVRTTKGDTKVEVLPDETARGEHFIRLQVNSASEQTLALAQIDDYMDRTRTDYPWYPPLTLNARMRFSDNSGPGTTGLFFWNNPIRMGAEFPDFRKSRWIGFYRHAPGAIELTQSSSEFVASIVPPTLLLRSLQANGVVEAPLDGIKDWTEWHVFTIEWGEDNVRLLIDDEVVLESDEKIKSPLGLVIWYDNNYVIINNWSIDFNYQEINNVTPYLDIDYIEIKPLEE